MSDANYRPNGEVQGDPSKMGKGTSLGQGYSIKAALDGTSEAQLMAGYTDNGKMDGAKSDPAGQDMPICDDDRNC